MSNWTRPTISEIYSRMKADTESRVTSGVKVPKVSLLGVMNFVFAGSVYLCYGFLVWLSQQLLPDEAETEGLDRLAILWLKEPRTPETYAEGVGTFSGTIGEVIPVDTDCTNDGGFQYRTTAEVTIGGTGTVEANFEALKPGTDYNMTIATDSLTINQPIPNVNSVVVMNSGFDNATDEESDADLQFRILQRMQNPPSSGTASDYERWALEADPEVGKSWCFPAEEWAGAGTVGVGVSQSDLTPLSPSGLTAVETYVDSVKPIPASTDYFTPNDVAINMNISISPNVAEVQAQVSTNITNIFLLESAPAGTMLLSHIRSAIASSGVSDYKITAFYADAVPIPVDDITQTGENLSRFNVAAFSSL